MSENNGLMVHVVADIWCAIVERAKRLDYNTAKAVMEKIKSNHTVLRRYYDIPCFRQVCTIGPTNTCENMYKSYVRYACDDQGSNIDEFADKLYELAYTAALMDMVPEDIQNYLSRVDGE